MPIGAGSGILIATDGSAGAVRAEALAVTIAAGCRSKLVVLTCSRGLPADDLRRLAQTEGDLGEARHALIARILQRTAQRAEEAGIGETVLLSEHGDPGAAIVAAARREDVALIVMGRRGVGALSQLLLGSVSKYVVDHAPCAVTLVP